MKILHFTIVIVISFANLGCQAAFEEKVRANDNSDTKAIGETTLSNTEDRQPTETNSQVAQPNPEQIIGQLYKQHQKSLADSDNTKDVIIQGTNRALIDKYFDKNLGNLIWKDLTTHRDDVGVIDFDLFTNSQDPDIKNLNVGAGKIEGDKATVAVTFNNNGRKEKITYRLVRQNNQWKISDINYASNQSLLKYFAEQTGDQTETAAAENGSFEGVYQVGNASCTVKATQTAFEVRWSKGSGAMLFFYSGEGVLEYSSEDKGKGVDTFVFDDASLTSGKFIRADGVEMTVTKK